MRLVQRTKLSSIPRGVILDLLDLYDLEIQVIDAFLEDVEHPTLKLNDRYTELAKEIRSLIDKWYIDVEIDGHIKADAFYIPFSYVDFDGKRKDSNLMMTVAYLSQSGHFEWGELDPVDMLAQMRDTRKSIRDFVSSEYVSKDESERDEEVQKIIADTKRVLSDLDVRRRSAGTTHIINNTTAPKTKLEGRNIKFDDEQSTILVDDKRFALTRLNKDYCFVRAMFDYQLKEAVDWNNVLEAMDTYMGIKSGRLYAEKMTDAKKHESLRKLANRVSKRLQDGLNTDDFLFTATDGSFIRNYGPP